MRSVTLLIAGAQIYSKPTLHQTDAYLPLGR